MGGEIHQFSIFSDCLALCLQEVFYRRSMVPTLSVALRLLMGILHEPPLGGLRRAWSWSVGQFLPEVLGRHQLRLQTRCRKREDLRQRQHEPQAQVSAAEAVPK